MNGSSHTAVTTMLCDNNGYNQVTLKKSSTDAQAIGTFVYDQWHVYKCVVNMNTYKYDVYIDGVLKWQNYSFREEQGSFTGHRFGINNKANGTIDFDNFKITVSEVE